MLSLHALRHRNFALFTAGQAFSLVGYWMQQVAVGWLVYRLTGSATLLGVLTFVANLPLLVLAPFVGLWADRFNRHRMMVITQVLEMLQAVVLTALAFAGVIESSHLIALTLFLGICIAIELPVRHAYLLELVGDKRDLANAIAVTSLVANCGRLTGPALAGVVIVWYDAKMCFLLNALSYVAVLVSFAFIRVSPQNYASVHQSALVGLKEGFVYAWRIIPIRFLLALVAVVALSASPYATLMPAVVHEAFAGSAQTLGFLIGASGLGAICGTLLLASRRNVLGLARFSVAATLGAGVALSVLSWSRSVSLSLALMVVVGFCILVISVSANMILQTIVDDDKRGRVMSLYTAAFLGIMPVGGLLGGMLADRIGALDSLLVGGIMCAAAGIYMLHKLPLLRHHIGPIYSRLGIPGE